MSVVKFLIWDRGNRIVQYYIFAVQNNITINKTAIFLHPKICHKSQPNSISVSREYWFIRTALLGFSIPIVFVEQPPVRMMVAVLSAGTAPSIQLASVLMLRGCTGICYFTVTRHFVFNFEPIINKIKILVSWCSWVSCGNFLLTNCCLLNKSRWEFNLSDLSTKSWKSNLITSLLVYSANQFISKVIARCYFLSVAIINYLRWYNLFANNLIKVNH